MITSGLTHVGHIRERNEDCFLIKEMDHGFTLLMVADGLGGHNAGNVASGMVRKQFTELDANHPDSSRLFREKGLAAHEAIKMKSENDESFEGMATTVTALLFKADTIHWVHVGDSRLYLYRDKKLIQITTDQNMAQFMVDEGELSAEEAQISKLRHVLEQCVGIDECDPLNGSLKIQPGDIMMLCTDGLHGALETSIISDLISQPLDLEKKTANLLNAALEAGGRDNITIILAEV